MINLREMLWNYQIKYQRYIGLPSGKPAQAEAFRQWRIAWYEQIKAAIKS